MPPFEYSISHTCSVCGNTDYFEVSKREAAFNLIPYNGKDQIPCSNCGSKEFKSWGGSTPELSKDLFYEWASNENLSFLSQDEDIFIADEKYYDIILELIDDKNTLPSKKQELYSALCVMVYDENIRMEYDNVTSSPFQTKVLMELQKRQLELVKCYVYDYIKDVVYPLIGLDKLQ
ncbi:hypothetical protein CAP35_05710 [Chitinophagaceae bacterium IBVUCB1]|nr:hypothetical protein CAP35_05710 [Chitinophagaceae bacterium IBVUCB1]